MPGNNHKTANRISAVIEEVIGDVSATLTSTVMQVDSVKPDGANTLPAMDAVARAGFQKITDGTETASVNTSSQLEVAEANSTTIKNDTAIIKADTATIKTDTALIKADVATVQDDIAVIKADTATIKTDTTAIKNAVQIMDDWDSADRCKVDTTGQTVAVSTVKPDGTNTMPSGDLPARAVNIVKTPNRPLIVISGTGGTITADWSQAAFPTTTQSASYDLWITDIALDTITDPTADTQPAGIAVDVQWFVGGVLNLLWTASIPNNSHIHLATPVKVPKNTSHGIKVRLGGSTNLNIYCTEIGFETA